ncbi:MAG: hypothetical protein ABL995_04605 [Bryobacteraceae bacterium]
MPAHVAAIHATHPAPNLLNIGDSEYLRSIATETLQGNIADWFTSTPFLTIKYGLIDADEQLRRLSSLVDNWDSYGAPAPSPLSISKAKSVLQTLCTNLIRPSTIVASASGGISIYFLNGEKSAYIENCNDGEQVLVMYDQRSTTDVLEIGTDIQIDDIARHLTRHLD